MLYKYCRGGGKYSAGELCPGKSTIALPHSRWYCELLAQASKDAGQKMWEAAYGIYKPVNGHLYTLSERKARHTWAASLHSPASLQPCPLHAVPLRARPSPGGLWLGSSLVVIYCCLQCYFYFTYAMTTRLTRHYLIQRAL